MYSILVTPTDASVEFKCMERVSSTWKLLLRFSGMFCLFEKVFCPQVPHHPKTSKTCMPYISPHLSFSFSFLAQYIYIYIYIVNICKAILIKLKKEFYTVHALCKFNNFVHSITLAHQAIIPINISILFFLLLIHFVPKKVERIEGIDP